MKPMLTQLWPQFTADAAFMDSYGSAIVERVVADRQNKIITVVYRRQIRCPLRPADA